tara:strand:- start:731 stop:922 length:192 start_codon:yes stop_codon:yes gene_type:complete
MAEETPQTVLLRLESHERECLLRQQMIEKRFDDGTKRFQRIENILWGLYGVLATVAAYAEFVK